MSCRPNKSEQEQLAVEKTQQPSDEKPQEPAKSKDEKTKTEPELLYSAHDGSAENYLNQLLVGITSQKKTVRKTGELATSPTQVSTKERNEMAKAKGSKKAAKSKDRVPEGTLDNIEVISQS